MAKAKGKKGGGVQVEKMGNGTEQTTSPEKPKEPQKEKNFIVVPVDAVTLASCVDEKSAAKLFAQDSGYAGKLLIVEADYMELHSVSHRIEAKKENLDAFVKQATEAFEAPEAE